LAHGKAARIQGKLTLSADATESSLRAHFTGLKQAKAERAMGDPVFALEHCLDAEQVVQLASSLSSSLRSDRRLTDRYWVSWVVHAAEQGYAFNGQEYWDSFAQRTQGWNTFGDRALLRDWFARFQRKYNGVCPRGRWSAHYRYISWPVTHALLPRDLQVQLAESIYNARFNLDIAPGLDPEDLGALIARYTYGGSSRYEGFLQQQDLVGRIVRALLQEDSEEQASLYRPTLDRITHDLTLMGHAREWMQEARSLYSSASIRMSAGQRRYIDSPTDQEPSSPPLSEEPILLTPHLMMRMVAHRRWNIYLEPPSFQAFCARFPEFRPHVERARYRIEGHGDSAIPSLGLLKGQPLERILTKWPADHQVLLRFEPPLGDFDHFVARECKLPPAALWLFRFRAGDIADFSPGLMVRPGNSYIVLSNELQRLHQLGERVHVACEGIFGVELILPAKVGREQQRAVAAAGLVMRQTVTVTPIGLSPRRWTGNGEGEWLTTEHPCFLLEHDHEFSAFAIRLNNSPETIIPCVSDEPSYVLVERLPAGVHKLTIATYDGVSDHAHPYGRSNANCDINLSVRSPATWTPGILCHEAFVTNVSPLEPTLDDFLSGRLDLHVEGDRARKVTCSLILMDAAGAELHREILLKPHLLPITTATWSQALNKFLKQQTGDHELSAASSGCLCIESEDLGEHRIRLTTQCEPLRWAIRNMQGHINLRLINEGVESGFEVRRYTFRMPLIANVEPIDDLLLGIDITQMGGLFSVTAPDISQSVIVDVPEARSGFSALRASIDVQSLQSAQDPALLMSAHKQWRRARACNTSARFKQNQVVRAIHRRLLSITCGEIWTSLEDQLIERPTASAWERLDQAVGPRQWFNYGVSLSRVWLTDQPDERALEEKYVSISNAYHVSDQAHAARIFWLIANRPQDLEDDVLDWDALLRVSNSGTMIRGARLMYLCKDLNRVNTP